MRLVGRFFIALVVCLANFASSLKLSMSTDISKYGSKLFKGKVAKSYLNKAGLQDDCVEKAEWATNGDEDKMAAAILEWAKDNDATSICHWFQPMCTSGLRLGHTASLYNKLISFDKDGSAVWSFSGSELLQGESDGSSYPNGGLRATHRAGAYLTPDPTSPVFIRDDVVYVPSVMVSYDGLAFDEKLPLLRSADALAKEGSRLMNALGYKVEDVFANIGLEQEFFFVSRYLFKQRPDLLLSGRTVMGKLAARGQELSDHYMAPLTGNALACMQEIQESCYKLGIPLKTRHKEVAPNQFEFAPLYGSTTTQIDQNLVVMQIIEETARKFGLAVLFQEKPFAGINGSGKHNNWSIATDDGTNLLNPKQLFEETGNPFIFPIIIAAIIKGVDEYGDLMRMAASSPGNDFRLGACEAPPAIMSIYLGDELTSYLKDFSINGDAIYTPGKETMQIGSKKLATIKKPPQDRNRSSPFPYGGNRFEFRSVGSSQNVSIVNMVLAAIVAKIFKEFSDDIEKGKSGKEVAQEALKKHMKVVFDGDGYDIKNQEKLTADGLWRIDSGVEAMATINSPKNVALFSELGILTAEECESRANVMLSQYTGLVDVEALAMIQMIQQHVIPAVVTSELDNSISKNLKKAVNELQAALKDIHGADSEIDQARLSHTLRMETMEEVRKLCDQAESLVSPEIWLLPTYEDLLFSLNE